MKKLLGFLVLAAAVSTVFSACNKEEERKFVSDLNTGHELVGQLYGENSVVSDPKEAQGIVFAVSPTGDSAYLCSFTDLMQLKDTMYLDGNRLVRAYKIYTAPTAFSTKLFLTNANDKDGAVNTSRIIAADTNKYDGKNKPSAAQLCREYFKKDLLPFMEQGDYNGDIRWESTKGAWYLPSMYELDALMQVKDRINERYSVPGSTIMVDQANENGFTPIGGDLGFAYWSSTEQTEALAWYDLPNSNLDTYAPKTWANEGGNGRIYVRPIRKVAL